MKKIVAAALGVAALAPNSANAAYLYSFVAHSSYNGEYGEFSFVSDSFVTSLIFLSGNALASCSVTSGPSTCGTMVLATNNSARDSVYFGTADNNSSSYYFDITAFSTLGTHETVLFGSDQAATLTVTDEDSTVPEPASWAMMIGGFGLMGAAMRRTKASVRFA